MVSVLRAFLKQLRPLVTVQRHCLSGLASISSESCRRKKTCPPPLLSNACFFVCSTSIIDRTSQRMAAAAGVRHKTSVQAAQEQHVTFRTTSVIGQKRQIVDSPQIATDAGPQAIKRVAHFQTAASASTKLSKLVPVRITKLPPPIAQNGSVNLSEYSQDGPCPPHQPQPRMPSSNCAILRTGSPSLSWPTSKLWASRVSTLGRNSTCSDLALSRARGTWSTAHRRVEANHLLRMS